MVNLNPLLRPFWRPSVPRTFSAVESLTQWQWQFLMDILVVTCQKPLGSYVGQGTYVCVSDLRQYHSFFNAKKVAQLLSFQFRSRYELCCCLPLSSSLTIELLLYHYLDYARVEHWWRRLLPIRSRRSLQGRSIGRSPAPRSLVALHSDFLHYIFGKYDDTHPIFDRAFKLEHASKKLLPPRVPVWISQPILLAISSRAALILTLGMCYVVAVFS